MIDQGVLDKVPFKSNEQKKTQKKPPSVNYLLLKCDDPDLSPRFHFKNLAVGVYL